MLSSLARRDSASVVGPGTDSAKANRSDRSSRQKYSERNSSCKHTIWAPRPAASRIRHSALARFSFGSREHDICTSPTRNLDSRKGGIDTIFSQTRRTGGTVHAKPQRQDKG